MELRKLKKPKIMYLVFLLVLGIFVIIISGTLTDSVSVKPATDTAENTEVTDPSTEQRLRDILEGVGGLSDVEVFVSYENKGTKSVATGGENTSRSLDSEKVVTNNSEPVMVKDGSRESPFVMEETLPEVRGIIISARGVDDSILRATIADAVSSALDVPLHRVKILSKD